MPRSWPSSSSLPMRPRPSSRSPTAARSHTCSFRLDRKGPRRGPDFQRAWRGVILKAATDSIRHKVCLPWASRSDLRLVCFAKVLCSTRQAGRLNQDFSGRGEKTSYSVANEAMTASIFFSVPAPLHQRLMLHDLADPSDHVSIRSTQRHPKKSQPRPSEFHNLLGRIRRKDLVMAALDEVKPPR